MVLFQSPPLTRYDLYFSLFGFQVRVHPLFWLAALLLGASSNNFIFLLIWVVVVFISILVHELGHALAMRMYGQPSHIVLYLGGGLTMPESVQWGSGSAGVSLGRRQEIIISFAGPLAGFFFALLTVLAAAALGGSILRVEILGIIPLPFAFFPNGSTLANGFLQTLLSVNFFWGLINLLPVYPLDGGNIARNLWIGIDPWDGVRKSLWLSVITGAVFAGLGLIVWGSVYIALLFGFLAFQSYQTLQRSGAGRFF